MSCCSIKAPLSGGGAPTAILQELPLKLIQFCCSKKFLGPSVTLARLPLGTAKVRPKLKLHSSPASPRTSPLNQALRSGSGRGSEDRKSTRLNSSHQIISYAVFCLKKK